MINSSQPFLYSYQNDTLMLYCYSDKVSNFYYYGYYAARPWKIHYKNLNSEESRIVKTLRYHPKYGSSLIECNPHTYPENPNTLYWNAGFSLGGNHPIVYYLVSMEASDPTFSEFDPQTFKVIQKCFTGTLINNQLLIRQTGFKNAKLQISDDSLIDFADLGFKHILKINKLYNQNKYILTGEDSNKNAFSVLLNEDFSLHKTIKNSLDQDVYKCSILDDQLVYTSKDEAEKIETRSLHFEEFNYE